LANELVETSPPLEFIDLSEAGPNAYAHAVELMSEETKRCFQTDDVLTLCRLIKLGETDYIWYLKQHHIVTDAHSFSVLWEQFGRLYQQIDDQAGATELVTQSMRNERANLQLENLRYHTLQSDISKDTRTIEFWEKQSKGVAPMSNCYQ